MIVVLSAPQLVRAQTADVATPPPNIVVPNYEGIPAGPFGGLEGSAYVARANDPSAAWFNPAGLSRAKGAQITGSAGLYQLTGVSPDALPGSGSSVQNLPNLVGFTVQAGDKLTLGMAILTPVSWTQTTNAQLLTTVNGNQERFAYSATSAFSRRVAAFSAGYDSGSIWRVGGGLTFMYTSLTAGETVSDRIAAPTDLRTLLVSSTVSGSDLQIGAVGGVQIDPSPHLRIGAVMRTSGFSVHQTGTATLDGTAHTGTMSLGASFLDASAHFHYDMPFEATGAIAFVGTRAELEVDVHGYSSVAPYALISSPMNEVIYRDTGNGAPPTVLQQPFPGLTSASRALANASVGGHVQLRTDRQLRLHYGIATDLSPVAPDDQVFDQVDLFAWTLGLSGRAGKLSYAAGVNYRGGTSHNIVLRNLISGEPVQTAIKISAIGMIYSLSYQF
jgi:hypothetical protein